MLAYNYTDTVSTSNALVKLMKLCFGVSLQFGKELKRVALLHNKDRRHFELQGDGLGTGCQLAHGDTFQSTKRNGCQVNLCIL